MAGSIASLFGPSAEQLVYDKQQQNKKDEQDRLRLALSMQASPLAQQFYMAGYQTASGLGGLFGKPMLDPAMTKAVEVRRLLADTNADDLNDPAKLTALATQFGDKGYAKEALYFADRARTITAENRAYELSMAKYQQDISEQVMEPNFKVKSTGDPVYIQNGKYFNANTGARVPVEDLISVKDITSASTPAVSEVISIENLYLDDTDFSEQEKDRVAKFLDEYALAIQKEPDFVNKPKEVALKEAWKRSTEQGIIAKTEDTWITKYTPFTATDWVFRPELMTEVPFKPVEDKSGKFKIKSITKN